MWRLLQSVRFFVTYFSFYLRLLRQGPGALGFVLVVERWRLFRLIRLFVLYLLFFLCLLRQGPRALGLAPAVERWRLGLDFVGLQVQGRH